MAEVSLNEQTSNSYKELIKTTGHPIRQIQEIPFYYPNIVKMKGSEAFVYNLPANIFEGDLVTLFSMVGTIHKLDFKFNRGSVVVTYVENFAAHRAVQELNNYELRPGHNIRVKTFNNKCQLIVSGIPKDMTRGDIISKFFEQTDGVLNIVIPCGSSSQTKNRGYAFIEYDNHQAAAVARRKLKNLWNTPLKIGWAIPEDVVAPQIMETVTVLFARNLSPDINEDRLRALFSCSGQLCITKVQKIRDCAFIHFQRRFEAQLALSKINGLTIDNCAIEVTWARPFEYSIRRQPHCNDLGSRFYPPHPLDIFSSSSDSALNEELISSAAVDFDTVKLLSSSTLPIANATASKFPNTTYPKFIAALCEKKGWGKPIYDYVILPQTQYVPMQYLFKLTVPGMLFDPPVVIYEFASTIDHAKNKVAYTMMAKLGLIGMGGGESISSTLDDLLSPASVYDDMENRAGNDTTKEHNDSIVNGIKEGILNRLSFLSLNSADNGEGDCGLFQTNLPYDDSASKYGAIPKRCPTSVHDATSKYGPLGFTPQ